MPLELNTYITIFSFLFSLGIQVAVLAYYAGKFSEMVRRLENDLKAHKQSSMESHTSLQIKLEGLEREKQILSERVSRHDIVMENIEKYLSELKESIKEMSLDIKQRRK